MTLSPLSAAWEHYANCPVPTFLLGKDSTIAAINPALTALLGYPPEGNIGRTLGEFQLAANLSLLPPTSDSLSLEERCYCTQGGVAMWVSQWQWALTDDTTIVQMLDISQRKQAESARAKRLDLLSRYADAVPGMVAYWRHDMTCAFANGAYREWFGKPPEEMPGIHIRTLLGEALYRLNERYILGALAGHLQQFERTLTKANGEIGHTWAQYVPDIEGGEVRGFFVLVSDITILKAAQAKLEEANTALAERTREAEAANQAKTLFLSMVSHELRSPLHTMLGYAELLQQQPAEPTQAGLRIIEASGRRLLRLINDILEFNTAHNTSLTLQPAPLSLPLFAEQIAKAGAVLASRRQNSLSVEIDTDLPLLIQGDEQRLNQAVMNLVDNACKFTERGRIHVHFSRARAPDKLQIVVQDDGPGIVRAEQQRIFEPFVRATEHRHHPGIGLGLAVVRQIVEGMDGTITLRSRAGNGSRFTILAPISHAKADLPLPTSHPERIAGYRGRRRTLLIAEDIEENLLLLQTLCTGWGFDTLTAHNGREAIALLQSTQKIDAVIVDQVMTHGDGWEVLKHIRHSARPNLPTILVSAQMPHPPAHLPPGTHFDATLQKPVSPQMLGGTIAKLLHLRWNTVSETPAAPTAALPALRTPPPSTLNRARRMLDLGQVVAIEQWAEQLAQRAPQHEPFARAVRERCAAIDLAGLETLLRDKQAP